MSEVDCLDPSREFSDYDSDDSVKDKTYEPHRDLSDASHVSDSPVKVFAIPRYDAILPKTFFRLSSKPVNFHIRPNASQVELYFKDDGTTLKSDLVISVQPPAQEGNRAELPVSTTDWRSSRGGRGQFIPIHGLDFLIGASSLLIQQTVELNDLTSRIDSENRYIVRVPHGESLYIASEVSSKTQRSLCGMGRSFVMHLHDSTRQEALVLKRRLAAASCLFPCRLQEMTVITPPGDYVGRIQQQWTWMVPFYLVRNATDDVLYVVEGPASVRRSALQLSEFKILTGDSLREVGKITHGWDRELVSFTTNIVFPNITVQPKHKALLLAAAFLLEYTYFERAKTSCWRFNCC